MMTRASMIAAMMLAAQACVSPATVVEVRVSTNIAERDNLTITARVTYGSDPSADRHGRIWRRVAQTQSDGGIPLADAQRFDAPDFDATGFDASTMPRADASSADAGPQTRDINVPFTFSIVPGGAARDARARLSLEVNVNGLVYRRVAVFHFTPRQRTVLRLMLPLVCFLPAQGTCANRNVPCTQGQFCEERGQTCGDFGTCIPIDTEPSSDLDASFDDALAPPVACGAYGEACCDFGLECDGALACVSGRCQRCRDTEERCCAGAEFVANGTECAPSTDPCKRPGVCGDGVCSAPVDAPDGTPCGTANPCRAASTCRAGACQPGAARANGTPAGGVNRCCSGVSTPMNTASNCNACGLSCATGNCEFRSPVNQYFCTCTGANAQCAPRICRSTAYPISHVCIPSDGSGNCTNTCPGGSTCHSAMRADTPNYCGY